MALLRSLSVLALLTLPGVAASTAFQPELPDKAAMADPLIEQLRFQIANGKRMKAMVRIGEGRDLAFIVDTGAERSAIATETAASFALQSSGSRRVVSFDGVGNVPTVRIPSLQLGNSQARNIDVLTFERKSLGADGLLGVDSLKDKVVFFDFDQGQMRIERGGATLKSGADSVRLDASAKDGRLMFSTARLDRVPTTLILDTGSDLTVGNEMLRQELLRRNQIGFFKTVRLLTTTGQVMRIDYTVVGSAQFGPVRIRNLPIAFSTVEPFRKLGLSKRPAMLLGMDALRAFGEVAVDFRHQQVRFTAKKTPGEMASR
jgi:predicted aspartyl protease